MDLPPAPMEEMIAVFNGINQYAQANGMALEVEAPGVAVYRMTVEDEHLSSPGTAHGGIVAGLMDATLGAAALSLAFTRGELVATVEFKINYFRPVRLSDRLVARGAVAHAGRRLLTARATIYRAAADAAAEEEEPVASGLGTFNAYPLSKRDLADFGTG